MKKIAIYEPAMCCSTGVCGVGVDPELIRISTVVNNLKKNEVLVERFNLSDSPQEFVNNKVVNEFINTKEIDQLPITLVEGEIIIIGRYPTNEEFVKLLNVPRSFLGEQPKTGGTAPQKSKGCGCSGGSCC